MGVNALELRLGAVLLKDLANSNCLLEAKGAESRVRVERSARRREFQDMRQNSVMTEKSHTGSRLASFEHELEFLSNALVTHLLS